MGRLIGYLEGAKDSVPSCEYSVGRQASRQWQLEQRQRQHQARPERVGGGGNRTEAAIDLRLMMMYAVTVRIEN